MADPFSIVAGVFGLSAIAVKVIISLSGYVDSVRGAKAEVQALSVDISTMHAILGELKIQMDEYPDAEANLASDSKNAVKRVLERCKTTLLGLERMVDKAQIVATESGMERMVKTVRWKFKDDEIKRFKELLREDKANLKMIMQILSRYGLSCARIAIYACHCILLYGSVAHIFFRLLKKASRQQSNVDARRNLPADESMGPRTCRCQGNICSGGKWRRPCLPHHPRPSRGAACRELRGPKQYPCPPTPGPLLASRTRNARESWVIFMVGYPVIRRAWG